MLIKAALRNVLNSNSFYCCHLIGVDHASLYARFHESSWLRITAKASQNTWAAINELPRAEGNLKISFIKSDMIMCWYLPSSWKGFWIRAIAFSSRVLCFRMLIPWNIWTNAIKLVCLPTSLISSVHQNRFWLKWIHPLVTHIELWLYFK